MIHPPFSKSPPHEGLSRSEAPGIWARVGCFLAQDYTLPELGPFPSSRRRPAASLSHQVPGEEQLLPRSLPSAPFSLAGPTIPDVPGERFDIPSASPGLLLFLLDGIKPVQIRR